MLIVKDDFKVCRFFSFEIEIMLAHCSFIKIYRLNGLLGLFYLLVSSASLEF